MKLTERLALLKAGYTKDEINAMIDEDALAPAQDPAPEEPAADQGAHRASEEKRLSGHSRGLRSPAFSLVRIVLL